MSRSLRALARIAALATLGAGPAGAEDYRTPRAGEAAVGTLFGQEVAAPERDRTRITYLNAGAAVLPDGPDGLAFGPQGGLYLWRAPESGESRLRAVLAGISNEVRYDRSTAKEGRSAFVASFDSLTLPWPRSEYAQGERLIAGDLEWNQARAGIGLAAHRRTAPGAIDNFVDAALTLEAGGLWFNRSDRSDPAFVPPVDTFEARLHLRVRADALQRNIVELPHRGWALGGDGLWGARGRWEPWGVPSEGLHDGGRTWLAASAFGYVAASVPGLSERHTVVGSFHAGIGSDLDRFSAFRLGSGSTWGDFETLSRVVLPAAGVDEIATSRYAVLDLEYRFEPIFFCYLQLRGTLAWADRPVRSGAGFETRTGTFPAVTAGLTSGLPWDLSLELSGSWNFGLEKSVDGAAPKGRAGFLVSLTKEF